MRLVVEKAVGGVLDLSLECILDGAVEGLPRRDGIKGNCCETVAGSQQAAGNSLRMFALK